MQRGKPGAEPGGNFRSKESKLSLGGQEEESSPDESREDRAGERKTETKRGRKGQSEHLGAPLPRRLQLITQLNKHVRKTEPEAEPPEKD